MRESARSVAQIRTNSRWKGDMAKRKRHALHERQPSSVRRTSGEALPAGRQKGLIEKPTISGDYPCEMPEDADITEHDYRIALMAWKDGLSVSAILNELGWPHDAQCITRVRRSLQKAMRNEWIELKPPPHFALEATLKERYPSLDCVNVEIEQSATMLRAARIVVDEIERFIGDADRKTFTCANAGGRTIAEVVRILQRLVPLPPIRPSGKRLLFVSLNAAEEQDAFAACSNYLCVRMSEIFAGDHLAVVRSAVDSGHAARVNDETDVNDGRSARQDYLRAVENADLVISAAGGKDGFMRTWLARQGISLPETVVGDVAFHPLDANGWPVPLADDQLLDGMLRRSPDWRTLSQLFAKRKLLLVLTGDKLDVAKALFKAGLPRRCVVDGYLAAQLCRPPTA